MRTYITKVTQKLFGLCRSMIIIRLNCHTLIVIDKKNRLLFKCYQEVAMI